MAKPELFKPNEIGETFIFWGMAGMVVLSVAAIVAAGVLVIVAEIMNEKKNRRSRSRSRSRSHSRSHQSAYGNSYEQDHYVFFAGSNYHHHCCCYGYYYSDMDLVGLIVMGLIFTGVASFLAISYGFPLIALGFAVSWGAVFLSIVIGLGIRFGSRGSTLSIESSPTIATAILA